MLCVFNVYWKYFQTYLCTARPSAALAATFACDAIRNTPIEILALGMDVLSRGSSPTMVDTASVNSLKFEKFHISRFVLLSMDRNSSLGWVIWGCVCALPLWSSEEIPPTGNQRHRESTPPGSMSSSRWDESKLWCIYVWRHLPSLKTAY